MVQVRNIHERRLPVHAAVASALLDSLAGPGDRLWPRRHWPVMRFDRPLDVDATGGHGPVYYTVEHYQPGVRIRFRFTAPTGFHGYHEYEVLAVDDLSCRLSHRLIMNTGWPAWLTWPLVHRPLHDALIEDSFDAATRNLRTSADRTEPVADVGPCAPRAREGSERERPHIRQAWRVARCQSVSPSAST